MKTVNEVSRLCGISVRTLHYYDTVGLLRPAKTTNAGYRLYDEQSLYRLQTIMFFREIDFSLNEIAKIMDDPDFDFDKALEQQIALLKLKKERIERILGFAEKLKATGVRNMDFTVFSDEKQKEYTKQAKEKWGETAAYKEFEKKDFTNDDMKDKNIEMMGIFSEFGKLRDKDPGNPEAQCLAGKLRAFITENFYNCTLLIFAGLGQMYAAGGEMTDNINKIGGAGTAEFASQVISLYCKK